MTEHTDYLISILYHLVWPFGDLVTPIITMHSFLGALFFISLLVTFAAARPYTAPVQKRGSFKVERVKNAAFNGHSGTFQLNKALAKYGMPIPPTLSAALEARKKKGASTSTSTTSSASGVSAASNSTDESGTVSATPESGDSEFLAPISIGGQSMNMDFDTGSSDLWVFNTQLSTKSQAGHTNFDPTKSSSFSLLQGASFSISYGDGSGAAGNVGTDTVNIGGASVTSQAVELATAVSSSFVEDTSSNGLVGLAFSKLNTVQPNQQKTFFDNVMSDLAEPVFTADLKHATAGAYEFGAIDSTKFNGSISWAAINTTNGFWQFSSTKFAVGSGASQANTDGQAIADTGTTLLLVNSAVASAYYSQVSGAANDEEAGGVTFPCNSDLPDLSVDIGGAYMATIPGSLINFTAVDAAGTTCYGGVQATTSDLQIYGDILFKSQFVAFNGGNNSIGMAPHS